MTPGRGDRSLKNGRRGAGCRGCPPSNSKIDHVDGGFAVGTSSSSRHCFCPGSISYLLLLATSRDQSPSAWSGQLTFSFSSNSPLWRRQKWSWRKVSRHRAYMRPFARQSHGSPAQTQSLNKTRLPLVRQKPICILPFFKPFSSDLRARPTSNRIAKTRKKVRPSLTRGLGVRLAVERG